MKLPDNLEKELKTIMTIVEEALKNIERTKEAANWADLRCVAAGIEMDLEGDFIYTTLIDEASPEAYSLQQQIINALCAKGYFVDVRTEW